MRRQCDEVLINEWGSNQGSLTKFLEFCRKDDYMKNISRRFSNNLQSAFKDNQINLWNVETNVPDPDDFLAVDEERPLLKEYLYRNPDKLSSICERFGGKRATNGLMFDYKSFLYRSGFPNVDSLPDPAEGKLI